MPRLAIGLTAVVMLIALASPASAAEKPGPSTPSAVLTAFTKALEEGDAAALAKLMTGEEKAQAWANALAVQFRSFKDLDQALATKYGKQYTRDEAGEELREQIKEGRENDLLTDLRQAKLGKPDGDVIPVIVDESAPDDRQGRLLREKGAWKVDIGSFSDYFSPQEMPGLKAAAAAAAALARDVAAGKYASLEDAAKAVEEGLSAAEDSVEQKKPAAPADKRSSTLRCRVRTLSNVG